MTLYDVNMPLTGSNIEAGRRVYKLGTEDYGTIVPQPANVEGWNPELTWILWDGYWTVQSTATKDLGTIHTQSITSHYGPRT